MEVNGMVIKVITPPKFVSKVLAKVFKVNTKEQQQ